MRPTGMPSRNSSASPDNSSANTSRRSSWSRSRRTFMACTECRRRQVKCTPSESAGQACERCAKRKIKCEFMSIQEQKLLSTPDNDQSSDSVTLHLPRYGGTVGGMSGQVPTGPILGDPADVRQGMLSAPANRPLVHPTGMPIPATTWPLHQPQQQIIHPSAQAYHRPGTPSWGPQQSTPTPGPSRYTTPTSPAPVPQSTTPAPGWYPVGNSQSRLPNTGYYPPGHIQASGVPDVQWKDSRDNKQS
ncbi:hypothetical protein BJ322DRAFT_1212352 [Thelephora terrestris]|uniref:Zn(2)-C6 fungal-type domain-containing protein n=1 Tax=Thelephora terrestris TaxID=56493 RepID=A0A9P6L4B8_9AGAM|nr:hypothetical protein BJ322DRAFT_1212352 [Thelephora terrestris]